MRYRLYSWLIFLLLPIVVLWALLTRREFLRRFSERFGFGLPPGSQNGIWIHAASVGEVQGISLLVRRIQNSYATPILFTTFTITGSQQVAVRFPTLTHCLMPWDSVGIAKRFLNRFSPRVVVVMETEIWPALFFVCTRRSVPIVLVNARIGDRALRRYQRHAWLFKPLFSEITLVNARSVQDAERFRALGVPDSRIVVTGNIKFSFHVEPQLLSASESMRTGWNRPVFLAASTHPGEEEIIASAFQAARREIPNLLLLLAPRHVHRAADVIAIIEKASLTYSRRSLGESVRADTDVFLIDTLGELLLFYTTADLAFIGGSLVPIGGHNPLEPAAVKCPIVSGRHVNNFRDEFNLLNERRAVIFVENSDGLAEAIVRRWRAPNDFLEMSNQAERVLNENQGALELTFKQLKPFIE